MSSSSFIADSIQKKIIELEKKINIVTSNQMLFTPGFNSRSLLNANLGSKDQTNGVKTGLETSQPLTHNVTDVDDNGVHTGVFDKINLMSSNVVIDWPGNPTINLKYILKTRNNGQKLAALTVATGKTLVLQAGGDLAIASDITLSDQDLCYCVYSEDIGDKFRVITSKGSTGGGTLWSGITIDTTKDMLQFALTNLSYISFDTASFPNTHSIALFTGSDSGIIFNNPATNTYYWKLGTLEAMRLSFSTGLRLLTSIDMQSNGIINLDSLAFGSSVQSITGDGSGFTFNTPNTGVILFNVGASNNILTLGVSTITAWKEIVMDSVKIIGLANPTNPQDAATKNYVDNIWSTLNINADKNFNQHAATNLNFISFDTNVGNGSLVIDGIAGTGMTINVPSSNSIFLKCAGTQFVRVSVSSGVEIDTILNMTSNTIENIFEALFSNSSLNPSVNGQINLNGSDLRVWSGGALRDLTQMAQLNGINIFTTNNTFNLGLQIKTGQFLILNANDTSDTAIRQSSAVGVTPKILDIECFADVVFKAFGENSTSLSRGLIKGMQQAADPTTTQIPSGYMGVNKNTSSGLVKLFYNDGGIMRSVTLS